MGTEFDVIPLEPRRHFDTVGFASLTNTGTLLVAGTASGNDISVSFDDESGLAVATRDGESQSFAAAAVKRIRVDAGGSDDRVTVSGPRMCTIVGGGGNDTLNAGRRDDSLDGGAGDDVMDGGAGNDFIGGGDGFDTADFFSREVGFKFQLQRFEFNGNAPDVPEEASGLSAAVCKPLNEVDKIGYFVEAIAGTSRRDTLFAGGGFDTLGPAIMDGRGGDDYFNSEEADVVVHGGAGNDTFQLHEFSGAVTIFAEQGDDLISGDPDQATPSALDAGSGHDTLESSGAFADEAFVVDMREYPGLEDLRIGGIYHPAAILIGNELDNRITGGGGESEDNPGPTVEIYGLGGNDTLTSGMAADRLFGGDGNDVLIGGLGNDTLRGEGGTDILGGDGGNDVLFGYAGDDNLNGGAGNDRLDGGAGVDTFNGGSGNDHLFTRDTIAEAVNGGLGTDSAAADDNVDVLFSVENVLA